MINSEWPCNSNYSNNCNNSMLLISNIARASSCQRKSQSQSQSQSGLSLPLQSASNHPSCPCIGRLSQLLGLAARGPPTLLPHRRFYSSKSPQIKQIQTLISLAHRLAASLPSRPPHGPAALTAVLFQPPTVLAPAASLTPRLPTLPTTMATAVLHSGLNKTASAR